MQAWPACFCFPPETPSLRPLPEAVRRSAAAYAACVAGASLREDYVEAIRRVGFTDIRIVSETPFPVDCLDTAPLPAFATEEGALSQGEIASRPRRRSASPSRRGNPRHRWENSAACPQRTALRQAGSPAVTLERPARFLRALVCCRERGGFRGTERSARMQAKAAKKPASPGVQGCVSCRTYGQCSSPRSA